MRHPPPPLRPAPQQLCGPSAIPQGPRQVLRSALTAALALVAFAGCEPLEGRKPQPDAATNGAPQTSSASAATSGSSPATARVAVAHDWVEPRFVPMGPAGGLPTGLVVEFGRPINQDDEDLDVRTLGFTSKPAIDVRANFVTPSTLRLRFRHDLAPDTQYTFGITSVRGDKGQIVPETPWAHTLVTPPFSLIGVRLGYAAPGRGNVVLYARFSARPDMNHVRQHVQLQVDGQPLKPESVQISGGEVEIRLASPRIVSGAKVSVAFAAGIRPEVTTAQSVALPAQPATVLEVGASTPLKMLGVKVAERPSGMGLVVHCDDPSSGPSETHWLHRYGQREGSPRCLPDETVLARYLRLDPAVPYTVKSDEAGFRIEADFKRGPVTLSLAAGMPTIDGGRLETEYTATVKVPARAAQVHIAAEGRYLPRGNWQALPVSLLNAARLRLRIRRVPPENLASFLNHYSEEDPDDAEADLVVDAVLDGFEGPQDRAHDAWVDLNQHLPNPAPGVYAVDLTAMAGSGGDGADEDDEDDDGDDDDYGYRSHRSDHSHAARRLVISDLQLVSKSGTTADGRTDEWQVHALDAHTLRSVAGVEIALLRKSGTALATCKTVGDTGCTVSAPTGTRALALSARKGNDYTYLDLERLQTANDSAQTYGKPYRDTQPYTLAPFTNRGVWRPGERVHAGVLVRGVDLKAPPAGLPVALKLVDARYNEVRIHTGVTDAAGLVTYEVPIPESGLTGTWRAQFEVAGDELAQLNLPIEDIVPERMAVSVKPAAEWVGPGAPARFKVSARYLFGGDATGSEVTAECRFEPKRLSPPGAEPELQFGALVDAEHDLGELSDKLGADGVDLDCPLPPNAPDGVVSIQVSVMEAGSGRATRGGARLKHHAAPLAVGLRAPAKPIKAGEATDIAGAVLNWDGTPATGELSVRVERLDPAYGWHLSAEDGEVWSRHLRATEVLKVNLKPDAKGRFAVPFSTDTDAEGYVAYAEVGGSKAKLSLEGARPAFAWRGADDWERADATRTPNPNQASDVPLHTPKEVEVGRAAEATFEAPFAGRALLTIETDRLESARWVDVVAGTNRWPFKITRFAPNMYLSVLVVKNPHLESKDAWLPDRALGVKSVRVIPQGQVLNPQLTVTAELRPGMPIVVQVDAGLSGRDAAMLDGVVVVSVVDEGILQLTRFKTPDPNADLLASRSLAVETFETFGWGLRLASRDRRSASGGGDGEYEEGIDDRAVVEPLAIWSGPIALDARGKAEVKLDLPRHTGKLRVMAVMADRARVGVSEAAVQVRDPLALLATAPLFARRGDRIELPVFLSNLTGAAADVKISVAVEGGVAFTGADGKVLAGPQSKTVSLAADEGHTAVFGARVTGMSGQARVRITATGGGVESHDELRIDLRPEGALERRTQTVAMSAGAPLDLTAHLDRDFLPGTEQIGVRLAADETEDALDHLRSLARYPHGCLEQTTSQARPLLALGKLFDDLSPGLNPSLGATRRLQNQAGLGLDDLVKVGIERVLALQTSGGGFAYWSGGTEPHYWGTTQAILFLMDAKAAGYAVQPGRIESALAWVSGHLDSEDAADYGRGHATEAWMHYTLARAGQGEKARIAQTLEATVAAAPDAAPSETVTLLRAALYLAGDRRYADALKAPVAADIGQARVLAGDFWSEFRERAVETSIFIELFGADPAGRGRIESLARHLRGQASRGYTTSELAWSLYAVARWRQASAANLPAVNLSAAAQPVAPRRPGSGAFWLPAPPTGSALVLSAAAGANVPLGTRVVLTQEGVRPPEKAWHGAEGLAVTRSIVDGDGKPVDLARVRLGQLVYVRLDLKNLGRESIPNVALVDPLPGGLAVENARLFGAGDAKVVKGERTGWMPEHLDLRDDRVAAFGTLAPEAQVSLVYAARAVVAGTWQAPGAELEAMYDPRLRARNAPGELTVIAPWTEQM